MPNVLLLLLLHHHHPLSTSQVRVHSSAASSSTGRRDNDIKVYDTVTWGAPAEHLDGFAHGGGAFALREKMNLYEAKVTRNGV